MIVLGLTGPTGSGKGIVADAFRKQGIPVLDTDAVYHEWIAHPSPCVDELVAAFGGSVRSADGGIDRPALAAVVFCGGDMQNERLNLLNSIAHRYVIKSVWAWLKEQQEDKKRCAVIDAPLLIEAGVDSICDKVIAVTAPAELRLARIMMRDGITEPNARARIRAQKPDDFYTSAAQFVFVNDGAPVAANAFVLDVINRLPIV